MNSRLDYHSENGASSILVIIMMVVLLVFGLAILTTSLSNLRLSDRKKDWLTEYYLLEGQAAAEIAAYDRLLLEADAQAQAYMETQQYLEDYMIVTSYISPEDLAGYHAEAYMLLVAEKLELATSDHEDSQFTRYNDFSWAQNFDSKTPQAFGTLTFSVELPDSSYDKHIQVAMDILAPGASNTTEGYGITNRYAITQHTQQQEAFQYDEGTDFGNPFGDEGGELQGNPFGEDPFKQE